MPYRVQLAGGSHYACESEGELAGLLLHAARAGIDTGTPMAYAVDADGQSVNERGLTTQELRRLGRALTAMRQATAEERDRHVSMRERLPRSKAPVGIQTTRWGP